MKNTTSKIVGAVLVLLVLGGVASLAIPPTGYNNGYEPKQPLAFPHDIHAGKLGMQCMYCHVGADKGKHALVPTLNVCMNCHKYVATDKPLIKDLTLYYNSEKSIPWVRIHMLPDFAHFNHRPHIAKGVACQTCHGPVQEMKQVYQYSDLSMGWCVNCHRKPENNAPITCVTCHY
jgi:hypothetical protein